MLFMARSVPNNSVGHRHRNSNCATVSSSVTNLVSSFKGHIAAGKRSQNYMAQGT